MRFIQRAMADCHEVVPVSRSHHDVDVQRTPIIATHANSQSVRFALLNVAVLRQSARHA